MGRGRRGPPRGRGAAWLGAALALAAILACGCWDNVDIKDRAFVLGIGVDRQETGGVSVSIQIPQPGASSVTAAGSAMLLAAPGADMISALHHVQGRLAGAIFLGQLKTIVLGETAARDPKVVEAVVDEVLRHPQVDPGAFIVVARDCSAQQVMAMTRVQGTPSALFVGSALEKGLMGLEVPRSEVWQFLRAVQTPGWEPTCGGVKCGGDQVEMADTAVFKNYGMVGWLGPHETRGYLWLIGEGEGAVVNIKAPEGMAPVLITRVSTMYQPEPGETPAMRISISVSAQLFHKPARLTVVTHEESRRLGSLLSQRIKLETQLALDKLQPLYQADSVGLGRQFYYRTPGFWRGVDWNEIYPGLEVKVTVKAEVGRKGQVR